MAAVMMVEHGRYAGPVDGTFDGDVKGSVKRMQRQLGVFEDGEYGPKTGGRPRTIDQAALTYAPPD